ncbi:hypothetical protein BaRGS_00039446 [Batillaria attramentaria]|uniref:Uncharacterized protein n=1 Tax=Batillaria attramentaria TaxID=370345 RepID=A0ABD0J369_9CAEN
MYVFLKFCDIEKVISNVSVDDDCLPMVDGATPVSPGGQHGVSVEAIHWFKALAMEAVYIDCSSRDARWCAKTVADQMVTTIPDPPLSPVRLRRNPKKTIALTPAPPPKQFMPETARPLFSQHPQMLHFDPNVDEMFERAEDILTSMNQGKMSNEDVQREVAQLLHVHVFPAVCFVKADAPVLEGCLRRITVKIRSVEREIMQKEQAINITETSLNKQKDRIVAQEELARDSYVRMCNRSFLDAFYVHVTKDIQTLNVSLELIQGKVNLLKRTSEDVAKLQVLKQERDGIHERLEILMQIREAIRNVLYRPHILQKKQKKRRKARPQEENCLHNIFLEVHETLKILKEDLKRLCYKKLHFSSMREAIEATLKVIKQDSGEVQGDLSEFSVLSTIEDRNTTWQSMQTKLSAWMEDKECPLYKVHMDGCQLIEDMSRSMLSDFELASMGLEPSDVTLVNLGDGDAKKSDHGVPGDSKSANLDAIFTSAGDATGGQLNVDARAHMVDVIKDQVKNHSWDMADRIVRKMGFDPKCNRHVNRAWLCYMPHFCNTALAAVERVYFHFHSKKVARLQKMVSSLALADIMDEKFFADLFVNSLARDSGRHRTSDDSNFELLTLARSHSMESLAAVSLDLQRCSVTDLYAIANKDGARLQQRLELDSVGCFSSASVVSHSGSDSGEEKGGSRLGRKDSSSVSPSGDPLHPKDASPSDSSDSGASVHSDDLFSAEDPSSEKQASSTITSSQTVASVVGLFESIVQPFHELVQNVLDCPDFFQKLQAVWRTNKFLSEKVTLHCRSNGMDSLLPMSIFAIVSLRKELFVRYYVQLLMLIDFKPDFCLHSMYDFSLMNAYSPYMFLFEHQVRSTVVTPESNV